MSTPQLVTFTLGFIVGGFVAWQVSAVVERFRRARRDFRIARQGLRTLIEMMVERAEEAIGWVIVGAITVGAVFYFWTRG